MSAMENLISEINSYYKARNKRPVFQLGAQSRFIIISQAPGKKVHETGIPWNDASGRKLRFWLGVSEEQFYNPEIFSIMPMDFCFPGKGKNGDLPPDPDCAPRWHQRILSTMENDPMKILIGQYAIQYYLGSKQKTTLAETVRTFGDYLPEFFPMPHPSPRNQNWLKKNKWFENQNIPYLQKYISEKIKGTR